MFLDYLKESAQDINVQLEDFYKNWRKEVSDVNPKLLPLLDLAIDASDGGKRLRGVLIKLGYELSGGKLTKEILKPAVAYEIFQTAILAHDDIIDRSETRRGKPTIYQALGADHYAASQTICLGDVGFFLAFQIFSEADFDPINKNRAISYFSKSMLDTGFGQMLDVELPRHEDKNEQDIITIYRYKTAWYTIVGPLAVGAILAGVDEEKVSKIKTFGENLGIAFQIQDDILGVFGDEKQLGKSVISDAEEGKLTLLYLKALEKADDNQKAILEKVYGKGQVSLEQMEQVRDIFVKTGAFDYAKDKAVEYVSLAKQVIGQISQDKKYQQILEEMSDYLVERNK